MKLLLAFVSFFILDPYQAFSIDFYPRESKTYLDGGSQPISHITYEYNDSNLLIESKTISYGRTTFFTIEYNENKEKIRSNVLDENHNLIMFSLYETEYHQDSILLYKEYVSHHSSGWVFRNSSEYEYTNFDKISLSKHYDANGFLVSYVEYEYSNDQLLRETNVYSAVDAVLLKNIYENDGEKLTRVNSTSYVNARVHQKTHTEYFY